MGWVPCFVSQLQVRRARHSLWLHKEPISISPPDADMINKTEQRGERDRRSDSERREDDRRATNRLDAEDRRVELMRRGGERRDGE